MNNKNLVQNLEALSRMLDTAKKEVDRMALLWSELPDGTTESVFLPESTRGLFLDLSDDLVKMSEVVTFLPKESGISLNDWDNFLRIKESKNGK